MEYHLTGQTIKVFEGIGVKLAPTAVYTCPLTPDSIVYVQGQRARVASVSSHPKIGLLLELQPA